MAALSQAQINHFRTRGYVSRIPVLTDTEVGAFRTEFDRLEAELDQASGGLWIDRAFQPWTDASHPFEDWFIELAIHPKVLDAVESVLGPNILVRNADVFTKDVGSEEEVDWHVDSAQDDPTVDGMLTAWIGLSPSNIRNGCMQFAVGTHRDGVKRGSMKSLVMTEADMAAIEAGEIVDNEMEPGELSLHHFRLVHRSSWNHTQKRRVGYVVRYMTPAVTQQAAEAGAAMLARGRITHDHFAIKPNFPVSWDVDHERLQAFRARE